MHDLGIGDPGRRRNRHDVAGAEEREARVEQRLLGTVRHDDVIGVHGPAARQQREVRCGSGAQLQNPLVRRVVRLPVLDRANAGLRRNRRRREIGLARTEVDDVFASRLAAFGFSGDGDRGGGLEVLQVGRQTFDHRGIAP